MYGYRCLCAHSICSVNLMSYFTAVISHRILEVSCRLRITPHHLLPDQAQSRSYTPGKILHPVISSNCFYSRQLDLDSAAFVDIYANPAFRF